MNTLKLSANIGDRKKILYSYDYEWDMEVPEGLTYTQENLLQKGFGELLRDRFSTFAKVLDPTTGLEVEATHKDKDRYTRSELDKLKAGNYKFGARGGSSTLQTPEMKAWIWFFNKKKIKEGGEKISGKNIGRALQSWVRQQLIQEYQAGTPERKDIEANIGKYLSEKYEEVIQRDQERIVPLARKIEAERMEAEADAMFS